MSTKPPTTTTSTAKAPVAPNKGVAKQPSPAPAAAPPGGTTAQPQHKSSTAHLNLVEFTETHKRELKQSFDLFDTEGTGRVPAPNIKVALRALGFEPSQEDLSSLLATVGKDVNSSIDFSEFMALLRYKMSMPSTKEETTQSFYLFDLDDTKRISFADLERVVAELGEALSEEELMEMIDFAAPSRAPKSDREKREKKDLYVTEEEFMKLMKKANMY
eukprot:PhM_4_TR3638/c0_g1_i1/m.27654/K16465/CETN1; centrin-1